MTSSFERTQSQPNIRSSPMMPRTIIKEEPTSLIPQSALGNVAHQQSGRPQTITRSTAVQQQQQTTAEQEEYYCIRGAVYTHTFLRSLLLTFIIFYIQRQRTDSTQNQLIIKSKSNETKSNFV